MLDQHPESNQYQSLITSRGLPLAYAYHVWSTSITAFVSYLAHRRTDTQTHTHTVWSQYLLCLYTDART